MNDSKWFIEYMVWIWHKYKWNQHLKKCTFSTMCLPVFKWFQIKYKVFPMCLMDNAIDQWWNGSIQFIPIHSNWYYFNDWILENYINKNRNSRLNNLQFYEYIGCWKITTIIMRYTNLIWNEMKSNLILNEMKWNSFREWTFARLK